MRQPSRTRPAPRWSSTPRSWTEQTAGRTRQRLATDKAGDKQSHYIWDMTFDAAGRLYIATGGPGAVYRVDPAKPGAKPELFFKSDEAHIRCAGVGRERQPDRRLGRLRAGLSHQSRRARATCSLKLRGARLPRLPWAPTEPSTRPAWATRATIRCRRCPCRAAGSVTITIVQPGSLQAANTSTSVPEGSEIYALAARRPGAAQALGRQGRDCLCAGRAAGRPAGADRQSRPHLPHSRTTAATPTSRTWKRSRA